MDVIYFGMTPYLRSSLFLKIENGKFLNDFKIDHSQDDALSHLTAIQQYEHYRFLCTGNPLKAVMKSRFLEGRQGARINTMFKFILML